MNVAKNLAVSLKVATACVLGISTATAAESDPNGRNVVTVAFGAGLNTAQPGNKANHHIVPRTIEVEAGDVVNFVVGGLHVIRVYKPDVRLRDIKNEIPDECEVNPVPPATDPPQCFFGDEESPVPVIPSFGLPVHYQGINPLAAPPPVPPFVQSSATINRVESVSFSKEGRYLVICAVLPHFNDGMIAWVEVLPRGSQTQQ
jgi:plastocyanin